MKTLRVSLIRRGTRRMRYIFFVLMASLLLIANNANASINLDWSFTNSGQTFNANDTIQLNAILSNQSSSTESIDLSYKVLSVDFDYGNTFTIYNFVFGSNNNDFFSQFNNIVLAPGQSMNFLFGTLTPSSPPVPLGDYSSGGTSSHENYININVPNGFLGDKTFEFTVATSASVPEPSTMLLLGSGLAGLVGYGRKRM